MAPKGDPDLLQSTRLSRKVQDLLRKLLDYVDLKSVTEDGYIYLDCANEGKELLKAVRVEVAVALEKSRKIGDAVKAMIPQPRGDYSLSSVQLLGLRGGPVELEDLGGQDICVFLIPVIIEGSGKAILEDPETKRRKDVTVDAQSGTIINGRCTLSLAEQNRFICVVLYIRKDEA